MNTYFRNAEWIFCKNADIDTYNSYFDYKAEFQTKLTEETFIYLSSCSQYALYINGQFIDCGQYPGYENYQVFDVLDITSYVTEGKNELLLTQYVSGIDCATGRKQNPGVIFTVWQGEECLLNSSTKCLGRVNPYYAYGEMERVTYQIGFTFKYNACQNETTWTECVLTDKEKQLYERPIKKLVLQSDVLGSLKTQGIFIDSVHHEPLGKTMQTAFLANRGRDELLALNHTHISWNATDESIADGVYFVFDAETENVGFLSLDFDVPEECDVLIGYGEHLEDLRVRSYVEERNFCGYYHAKPGRNQFFHPFLRMGMRYLQIHIYSKTGTLYHAGIRPTYYPLKVKECNIGDALHRKIYEVGVRTLQHCMHEHYEDCPWREQALYTFDSRIQMLCGYHAFEEYDFPKASLRLMLRSLREDGTLELCAPGKVAITIPSFTPVFIRQLYEYFLHSNDADFVKECFGELKYIIDSFEKRIAENGLIPCFAGTEYWNFYEWKKGLSGGERYTKENAPYELPLNAIVSDAFSCFAKLCELASPELSAHYNELHQCLNKHIHLAFYDDERNVYFTRLGDDKNSSLHVLTQALALYAGVVPNEHKKTVLENMLNKDMIPCTLSSSIYKYDALLREGDTYWEYVKKDIEKQWGNMLFSGATTFWETAEGHADFNNAGSLCHGWSAVPIYLYATYNFL